MLTGLTVSSLACKGAFYRPERIAKGDPMELNFDEATRDYQNHVF